MTAGLDIRLRRLEAEAAQAAEERVRQGGATARIMARLDAIAATMEPASAPANPAEVAAIRARLLTLGGRPVAAGGAA